VLFGPVSVEHGRVPELLDGGAVGGATGVVGEVDANGAAVAAEAGERAGVVAGGGADGDQAVAHTVEGRRHGQPAELDQGGDAALHGVVEGAQVARRGAGDRLVKVLGGEVVEGVVRAGNQAHRVERPGDHRPAAARGQHGVLERGDVDVEPAGRVELRVAD